MYEEILLEHQLLCTLNLLCALIIEYEAKHLKVR